jgi:hypothetical protein
MVFKVLLRSGLFLLILALSVANTPLAHAQNKLDSASEKSRIYLLTATYGVVAGSLTGLGSLAFYDSPSKHSRNIAMGASIGLYVGLLLGAYMIYSVPSSSGPQNKSNPGSPAPGRRSGDGPVLEDPLRLDSSISPRSMESYWAPYLAYDEKQKSLVAGLQVIY